LVQFILISIYEEGSMSGTIFITGATAGFGESCANLFGKAGWKLILVGRRMERLEKLQASLGGKSVVLTLSLDLRDRDAVEKAVADLPNPFREVDVLLNNAGLALGLEPSHAVHLDDWEAMVDTNIKGLLYCTRCLLPGMVERNRGHVINIGSVAGTWPYPGGNVYGGTKAFVKQFSHNLRCDLLGKQIRVTNIEPGLAETEFSIVRFKGDKEKAFKVYEGTQPLTPEDLAGIIYWVATLPAHVNINSVEVMPTCQAWGPYALHRQG
jgi:NADP-dependent 3-hydroxy acid dehydrogenase YdfG